MKQIIIIFERPADEKEWFEILEAAKHNQPIPSDVLPISNNAFLIDIHKCLPFFASLVHKAQVKNVPYYVFDVEDIIHAPLDVV